MGEKIFKVSNGCKKIIGINECKNIFVSNECKKVLGVKWV